MLIFFIKEGVGCGDTIVDINTNQKYLDSGFICKLKPGFSLVKADILYCSVVFVFISACLLLYMT